jgi:hypothetical protein
MKFMFIPWIIQNFAWLLLPNRVPWNCDVDATYEHIRQLEKKDKNEEDTKEVVNEETT